MPGKILLIEDDESLYEAYRVEFEAAGLQAVSAKDGTTGLEKAKTLKPDLILLDIMLPNGDGISILQKLKAAVETRDIPVVMLTNFGNEETIKNALESGAEDFILKYKVVPAEVVTKVKEVLGQESGKGIPLTSGG